MKKLLGFLFLALLAALAASVVDAEVCSYVGGCSDCESGANGSSCVLVSRDAFCSCTIYAGGPANNCGLTGICSYTSGGGGGPGGGGGGGGGGACTVSLGEWCPPSCTVCRVVLWY
jgi:hypothetical protein